MSSSKLSDDAEHWCSTAPQGIRAGRIEIKFLTAVPRSADQIDQRQDARRIGARMRGWSLKALSSPVVASRDMKRSDRRSDLVCQLFCQTRHQSWQTCCEIENWRTPTSDDSPRGTNAGSTRTTRAALPAPARSGAIMGFVGQFQPCGSHDIASSGASPNARSHTLAFWRTMPLAVAGLPMGGNFGSRRRHRSHRNRFLTSGGRQLLGPLSLSDRHNQ